jgi:hypothetical protein
MSVGPLVVNPVPTINVVEGLDLGDPTIAVATFTDTADPNAINSTVVIDFGDNNPLSIFPQVVSDGSGGFRVLTDHIYADEGTFPVKVTITDTLGNTATVTDTVMVADGVLLLAGGQQNLAGTVGTAINTTNLVTFTDQNPSATSSDFAAIIDWGDGTLSSPDISTAIVVAGPTPLGPGFVVSAPAHTYNHAGTFNALVMVTDDGGAHTNTVSIPVTVSPSTVNQPPVAATDAYTFNENNTLTVPAPGVLSNDTDPDGDPLTASLVSGPQHGTLNFNADGSFIYTPVANYHGPDSFSYMASDGQLNSAPTAVSLIVNFVNHPPVAASDAYTVNENNTLTVAAASGVLSNDVDPDADPLTASLVSGPQHGTLNFNADGSFIYTPVANYYGPDSFSYMAKDAAGAVSAPTAVSLIVNFVNPPTANPYFTHDIFGQQDSVVAPGVLASVTPGTPGDTLTVSAVNGSAANVGQSVAGHYGSLQLFGNGHFVYTASGESALPSSGVAEDIFNYTALEGGSAGGGSVTSTLTVTVTAPGMSSINVQPGQTVQGPAGHGTVLDGSAGNGTLMAGKGATVLVGGPGDILTGSVGTDTYVFMGQFGQNTITNYNPNKDLIQLDHNEFTDLNAVMKAALPTTSGPSGTVITDPTNSADTITLIGVAPASLHFDANHFLLA